MLGIRRETDYAVRTVLHLAAVGDGDLVQVKDVAAQKLLPLSFVRRIVARLSAAGIIATTRGMNGGIRLARPARDISLLDVVLAMGDGPALNQCLQEEHTCPLAAACPAQSVWAHASAILAEHLATVRFDALARGTHGHAEAHRAAHRAVDRRRARPDAARR